VNGTARLSIVTPAFNEADNLPLLYTQLSAAADATGLEWEWIVVDDHSRDRTFEIVADLSTRDPRIRGVRFARNAGSHIAIACGLDEARGAAAVVLAADLQDPPDAIPPLVARWRGGAEVVWAARRVAPGARRSNGLFARLYYWMMRRPLGMTSMPEAGADFFLIDRKVIDAVRQFREAHINVLALITWLGFRQEYVEYDKQPRLHGISGWSTRQKAKLMLDSLTGFSDLPVTACWAIGLLFTAASVATGIAGFAGVSIGPLMPPFVIVAATIGLLGGVLLVMLGLIGEYIWRTFDLARGRPRYIVEARTAAADHRARVP